MAGKYSSGKTFHNTKKASAHGKRPPKNIAKKMGKKG